MDRKEAFQISKRMMDGQKMETFILDLSFIGWILLSAITCGIVGIFYVNPIQGRRHLQNYMHLIKQKHMRKDISDNGKSERKVTGKGSSMAINKSMRRVLKASSFDGIEVEASRHLANLKAIDPMKIFHKTIDYKIYNGDHQIPVRIFLPGEKMEDDLPVFLVLSRRRMGNGKY